MTKYVPGSQLWGWFSLFQHRLPIKNKYCVKYSFEKFTANVIKISNWHFSMSSCKHIHLVSKFFSSVTNRNYKAAEPDWVVRFGCYRKRIEGRENANAIILAYGENERWKLDTHFISWSDCDFRRDFKYIGNISRRSIYREISDSNWFCNKTGKIRSPGWFRSPKRVTESIRPTTFRARFRSAGETNPSSEQNMHLQ